MGSMGCHVGSYESWLSVAGDIDRSVVGCAVSIRILDRVPPRHRRIEVRRQTRVCGLAGHNWICIEGSIATRRLRGKGPVTRDVSIACRD